MTKNKRKTIILWILIIPAILFSQKPTLELTFTAKYSGIHTPLDSILVENLTQGGDTTLYSPDTLLLLDYEVSIGNNKPFAENIFTVSQNHPNPFREKTEVNLYLPEKENIKITIRDIMGRQLTQYRNILKQGYHTFTIYSGNEKYYLLTVSDKYTSKTIKMLNANSPTTKAGKCKIVYIEFEHNVTGFKSQEAKNNFGFNLGNELRYTGYAMSIDAIPGSAVISDLPEEDTDFEFTILKGIRCPGFPTVTDVDSNTYNTVQIGTQCWMKENLKTTTYQNNTPIPNIMGGSSWSNLITGAYVWYGNDISSKDQYGALYNWFAVNDLNSLCPSGWHVPENDEWTTLTNFIGGAGAPHGNQLKSCRQAMSPLGVPCHTADHPRWEPAEFEYGTDDYGFSALPGSGRFSDGSWPLVGGLGLSGFWWSSTETSTSNAIYKWLYYDSGDFNDVDFHKQCGRSVRCIKD